MMLLIARGLGVFLALMMAVVFRAHMKAGRAKLWGISAERATQPFGFWVIQIWLVLIGAYTLYGVFVLIREQPV